MKFDISLNGNKYVVEIDDSKAKILEKKAVADTDDLTDIDVPDFDFGEKEDNASAVKASLPGTVISVNVSNGEKVIKGQTLLVLESMKMENAITAPSDGLVENVFVSVGNYVTKDQELLSLKLPETAV